MKYEWFHGKYSYIDIFMTTSCDSHVTSSLGNSPIAEGDEFVGHAPAKRDVELKFVCRVSLEGNPNLFVESQTAKVKVKTGRIKIFFISSACGKKKIS